MNRDTIPIYNFIENIIIVKKDQAIGPYWACCGLAKCDGYLTSYYPNGNKMFEGLFKNGKAIGWHKYFRSHGTIGVLTYYDKKGEFVNKIHFWSSPLVPHPAYSRKLEMDYSIENSR